MVGTSSEMRVPSNVAANKAGEENCQKNVMKENAMQPAAREESVELATKQSTASACLKESEEREKAAKAVTPLPRHRKARAGDCGTRQYTGSRVRMHGLEP